MTAETAPVHAPTARPTLRLTPELVEDITQRAKARTQHPVKAVITFVLSVIGGILLGSAWLTYKAFAKSVLAFAWAGTALSTGWKMAKGTLGEPTYDDLMAENDALRKALARMDPGG